MRHRRVLLVAFAIAALAVPAGLAGAGPADTPHYPDLRPLRPTDLQIWTGTRSDGTPYRELRLSTTVWNAGDGPLELHAVNSGETTSAFQRVFSHDGSGAEHEYSDEQIGTFVFHPTHFHWHFEGFGLYEIRALTADGGIGKTLRRGQKVSFCIIPTTSVNTNVPHSGWGLGRYGCGGNSTQGLPPGYGDTYGYHLDGQSIDLGKLRDGTYWLTQTVDFLNRMRETDETNNRATVKIQITGTRVRTLR